MNYKLLLSSFKASIGVFLKNMMYHSDPGSKDKILHQIMHDNAA